MSSVAAAKSIDLNKKLLAEHVGKGLALLVRQVCYPPLRDINPQIPRVTEQFVGMGELLMPLV